jgi:hypothetical protein
VIHIPVPVERWEGGVDKQTYNSLYDIFNEINGKI